MCCLVCAGSSLNLQDSRGRDPGWYSLGRPCLPAIALPRAYLNRGGDESGRRSSRKPRIRRSTCGSSQRYSPRSSRPASSGVGASEVPRRLPKVRESRARNRGVTHASGTILSARSRPLVLSKTALTRTVSLTLRTWKSALIRKVSFGSSIVARRLGAPSSTVTEIFARPGFGVPDSFRDRRGNCIRTSRLAQVVSGKIFQAQRVYAGVEISVTLHLNSGEAFWCSGATRGRGERSPSATLSHEERTGGARSLERSKGWKKIRPPIEMHQHWIYSVECTSPT